MAADKQVVDEDPKGGGSYIRNEDGSLSRNEEDPQTKPADAVADEPKKED